MSTVSSDAKSVTDAAADEDFTPSNTILNGLKTYGVIGLCGWIGFEIARRKLSRAYYCRDRSEETTCPTVQMTKTTGFWKWIWPIYATSDDVIFEYCGLDTLFFLRFLRLCQKVAFVAILLSAANFPVYYYAQRDSGDALYKMTLSHLTNEQKWRFWLTVATMYIVSATTCFLLWREWREYVRRRHEFLGRKRTQQYSIVLNGLPKHLCTQQTLKNYLHLLFPHSVLYVYVALECGDLEKLVAERVKIRNKLEHALALTAKNGERALASEKMCGQKVDAIELYQDKLKSLNNAVEMEVRSILRNQAALANELLEASTNSLVNTPTLGDTPAVAALQETEDTKLVESAYITSLRKQKKGIKDTGIMRGAGFVTFNSLKAAQSAQQVLQSANPTEMQIEAASHVDDIVWGNIGVSYNQKQTWLLISIALTTAIILFWTIPTGVVVTLAKVSSLRKKWSWLDGVIDDHPWVGDVLEQLSPLMLAVMTALAPIIFGVLSKREGHASNAQTEASLLNKLVAYQIYVVFLLPIIGGTVIDSITGSGDNSLTDISYLVKTVSIAVPVQSSFFNTYLLVQMGLNLTLELLRVVPIIKAAIYQVFAPKLTPRQRESPWFGLTPLSEPGDFGQNDVLSQYYLVLVLILVFCAVAPILNYTAFVYLFLSDLVYRWSVLCICDPSPNGMGTYFPVLYRFCIGALIFSQIIMASLLATKEVALPATFALILPAFTVLFHLFIASRYPRTAENLPLDQCVLIDSRRSQNMEDLGKVLEDIYAQPAMAERDPIEPDYAGLTSDPNEKNRLSSPPSEMC